MGAVGAFGRPSGPPATPIAPVSCWTRAFGPCPIRVQEGRARSWTTRGKPIWEIPGKRREERGTGAEDSRDEGLRVSGEGQRRLLYHRRRCDGLGRGPLWPAGR